MTRAFPTPHANTPSFEQIRAAVATLDENHSPSWGTMGPAQMLTHVHEFNRLYLGRISVSAPLRWMARGIGPFFLRRVLVKSPTETPRNLRTLGDLKIEEGEAGEVEAARQQFLESLAEIEAIDDPHPHILYGTMRATDVHSLVRHHLGHHLHQFGLDW
ncbi:MAG: hypothetical protein AAF488_18135 [Planctomycetota bacterium]